MTSRIFRERIVTMIFHISDHLDFGFVCRCEILDCKRSPDTK